ncbi:hypothetical protein A9Q99_07750 [Gammaproteobacteria bacterium 45_16_T64]|nr:hypothetical protein A9Q99_07750 [Gammaproteobacteria bacterium 45_16_T64]
MNRPTLTTLLLASSFTLAACSTAPAPVTPPKPPSQTKTNIVKSSVKSSAKPTPKKTVTQTKQPVVSAKPAPAPTKKTTTTSTVKVATSQKVPTPKKVAKPKKVTTKPLTTKRAAQSIPKPVKPSIKAPKETVQKTAPTPIKPLPKVAAPTEPANSIGKETNISPSPALQMEVTLDSLPMNIGAWTLDRSSQSAQQCSLVSQKNAMPDGQGVTPIYLEITRNDAILFTKSNIDLSYPDSGLFIDQKKQASLGDLYTPTSVTFSAQYPSLINTLKNNANIEFRLGFWPSWPITQTYSTTLMTTNLPQALTALATCNNIL